jgi:hypothetical protein
VGAGFFLFEYFLNISGDNDRWESYKDLYEWKFMAHPPISPGCDIISLNGETFKQIGEFLMLKG